MVLKKIEPEKRPIAQFIDRIKGIKVRYIKTALILALPIMGVIYLGKRALDIKNSSDQMEHFEVLEKYYLKTDKEPIKKDELNS